MSDKMSDKATATGSLARPLLVTALAVLAGFAAVYVTLGRPDNARPTPTAAAPSAPPASSASPASSAAQVAQPKPAPHDAAKLNVGEVAAFVFKKEPEALAEISFVDAKGAAKSLKDWHGRVVLLNLWATWCAPCRKEMPGLARLQKELGSDQFEVVALAVDRAGAEAAAKFLGSIDAKELALYVDATARSGTALRAVGMPTTILIDAQGREIGRLTGPAEWDQPEAKRLIRAYLK